MTCHVETIPLCNCCHSRRLDCAAAAVCGRGGNSGGRRLEGNAKVSVWPEHGSPAHGRRRSDSRDGNPGEPLGVRLRDWPRCSKAADTTLPAKQYICLQLRQVGTPAQVPLLAQMLTKPETSQMARYALEAIPGDESIAALRSGLGTLQGDSLVGVINSVAVRKDAASVAKLQELAGGSDAKIAAAAFWALGNIATPEAIAFVIERTDQASVPMPQASAVPLLRCANALAAAGNVDQAQAIYVKLAASGQAVGVRRAALAAILQLQKEHATETILSWISDADADRRVVANGRLASLSDAELDRLAAKLAELPEESQLGLIEVLALRKGKDALPLALSAARSDKLEMKLAGIRLLGQIGDASTITILTDSLAEGGKVAETAQQALRRLPREAVGKAMLTALAESRNIRGPVLGVLQKLKYYEAIDPLIAIAGQEDPSVYEPALDALRGIADPDDTDLSRLVKLLLAVQGKHREEVERTILIVCQKSPDAAADRAKPVLAVLAKVDSAELPKYLPLLGRLGGPQVLAMIDSSLASGNPEVKASAIQGVMQLAERRGGRSTLDDRRRRQSGTPATGASRLCSRCHPQKRPSRGPDAGHASEGHEIGKERGRSTVGVEPRVHGAHHRYGCVDCRILG